MKEGEKDVRGKGGSGAQQGEQQRQRAGVAGRGEAAAGRTTRHWTPVGVENRRPSRSSRMLPSPYSARRVAPLRSSTGDREMRCAVPVSGT